MSVPNFLHPVAEYLAPTLKESRFQEEGKMTPDEFVAAGDYLVAKCPTWSWQGGEESGYRSILPKDKQFLLTRNVPCLKRSRVLEYAVDDEEVGDDGWYVCQDECVTHKSRVTANVTDIPDMNEGEPSGSNSQDEVASVKSEESDIPDMEDFDDDNLLEDDPAALEPSTDVADDGKDNENILKTRTYDLSMTYDKYYQTPRVWLFGYDEHRQPLTPEQIFEDISQEHANKTVTIETHPHLSLSHASIHPCRHAEVMKKLMDQLAKTGEEIRVDQYLFLFLKFISSVIPTIEYDYTS